MSLRLDDGTTISNGLFSALQHSYGPEGQKMSLAGIIGERVIRPADADASYVLFFLPNFEHLCGRSITYPDGSSAVYRLVLSGEGWRITLDAVEKAKEIEQFLAANSGIAITQVGRLEREDGDPFKAEDALVILNAVAWYVSFACGRWTGPCLPTGFDRDGRQVWEVWDYNRTLPFRECRRWLDKIHGEQFEGPFSGFLKLWLNEAWEEVIRVAIHWFIEANAQAGSIEGSIVLTQTAFELLASAVLVENYGWLTADGYEKLAAADRIRLLFLWAGIPTWIPTQLSALLNLARADNWPDTSTAMTMIRNTITHPTKKNREKFGRHTSEARTDAWILGLWNLELCLLRLFEYRGTYANRITQKFVGEIERVPWLPSDGP
jgi:hypothetical protein